jgi:hypothetical protein
MEPEGSLPHSQESSTSPYPERDESILYPPSYILRIIAVNFTLEHATKVQKRSRCIALLYLEDTF